MEDGDTITPTGGADVISDWTDGEDTIDTGSTNNITYLVATTALNTAGVIVEGNNYAIRGSMTNANTFTQSDTGADVFLFKASTDGNVLADATSEKFFLISGAAGDLTAADFV